MGFRRRQKMADRRDISLSGEKRLEKLYPHRYPKMHQITPGRVAADEDEDDAFSQWLKDTPPSQRGQP